MGMKGWWCMVEMLVKRKYLHELFRQRALPFYETYFSTCTKQESPLHTMERAF
jgi:hypothetical protein